MSLITLISVLFLAPSPVLAQSLITVPPAPTLQEDSAALLSKPELLAIATSTAAKYHLNADHFVKTINCESNWNPDTIGDHGESFGLVQIHLIAHQDISKEQALNPRFAIQWMANEWANDNASIWTCWRQLEATGWK